MPRLIGLLLLVMYSRAIYLDPPVFVGQLCGLCMPQKETPAEVWKATSTQIKGAVYQTGGWAAAFAVMVIWLSFQPQGQKGLCKGVAIAFMLWQFFWYVRIYPVSTTPLTTIFLKESLQEIIFISGFGYLGFIAPTEMVPKVRGEGKTAWARVIMLGFVCTLLTVLQIIAYFDPARYVTMEGGMVNPKGQDAQAVWDGTPTHSKVMTLEQAGWVTCLTSLIVTMLVFEPGCDRALCIGMALVMAWWNCVWYLGVFGNVDVDGSYKVPFTALFKNEAPFELPFIAIFTFLGVIEWGKEEEAESSVVLE